MSSMANWPLGFMVVQGNRMEDLCTTYVQWLKRYPLGPLEEDLLLAQSNGIAQWLKQTLARDEADGGCGVAAAINTMLPGQFVWHSYCALLPGLSSRSVYDKQALTWRLYRLLATWNLDQLAPILSTYVQADSQPIDRLQLARQLADLYDQYQVFRPDWLGLWEQGYDLICDHNGQREAIPTGQEWQPVIWRALCADITTQTSAEGWSQVSRTALHERFLQACANTKDRPIGLPRRVVVFGMSSLPNSSLEVLRAIAPFTQVLLFVMNPSQHYWGDMVEGRELLRKEYKRQTKRQDHRQFSDDHLHVYGNPLLASWGKQGRDFLHLFDEWDQPNQYQDYFANLPMGKVDIFSSPATANGGSLLARIQDDILQLRSAQERAQLEQTETSLEADDHSLEFISAHSIQREIEILHDKLLNDFDRHQQGDSVALETRDILVMVPDISTYAPHIEAVFGRYRSHAQQGDRDSRFLPYHIADTGQRFANPILGAFETLLGLTQSRMTSVQGLSLLEVPACRERFGIQETDLQQIKVWVEKANIRWALTADHRQQQALPTLDGHNTWQAGIDRLLLGFATDSLGSWQAVAACPEVSGLGAELLGSLSRFVNSLEQWRQNLQQTQTASQWVEALLALWQDFFVLDAEEVERLYKRISEYLQHWQEVVTQAAMADEPIAIELVQSALLEQLDSPSLSSRFITGAINFATLMPMRAVPFKQIWLLGMNDDAYPRKRSFNDFDLIGYNYRPGDRSRRDDDRYLFLEALLSARDKLVISWHGRSIKDDTEQPPSVLVAQLRDYIAKAWPAKDWLQELTTQYPLQPFSDKYFADDKPLFTYAREWASAKGNALPTETAQLPPWLPERPVSGADLVNLLKSPIDSLYQQRLLVPQPQTMGDIPSTESFTLDGLQNWYLHSEVLKTHVHNYRDKQQSLATTSQQMQEQMDTWQRDGTLLAGTAGQIQAGAYFDSLLEIYEVWQQLHQQCHGQIVPVTYTAVHSLQDKAGQEHAIPVEINLGHLQLDQHSKTGQQVIVQASKALEKANTRDIRWRNLCAAWVEHLGAHLYSQMRVTSYLLTPQGQLCLPPMAIDQAETYFANILTVWHMAMHEPLPLSLQLGIKLIAEKDATDTVLASTFDKDLEYSGHYLSRHFPHLLDMDLDRCRALANLVYTPLRDGVEVMS
ncbi:MAG TPA: exodeoxyribonuclease V subunit gamma [Oceanospirillaceae bacterium]|nr:exodeoxyribonuclease V subunit gamma [Oceanospirillaceae bacterium]